MTIELADAIDTLFSDGAPEPRDHVPFLLVVGLAAACAALAALALA